MAIAKLIRIGLYLLRCYGQRNSKPLPPPPEPSEPFDTLFVVVSTLLAVLFVARQAGVWILTLQTIQLPSLCLPASCGYTLAYRQKVHPHRQ